MGARPTPFSGPSIPKEPLANGHISMQPPALPNGGLSMGHGARPPFMQQQQQYSIGVMKPQSQQQAALTPSSPRPHAISISGTPSSPPTPLGPSSRPSSSGGEAGRGAACQLDQT